VEARLSAKAKWIAIGALWVAVVVAAVALFIGHNGNRGPVVVAGLLGILYVGSLLLIGHWLSLVRREAISTRTLATRILVYSAVIAALVVPVIALAEDAAYGWQQLTYNGREYWYPTVETPLNAAEYQSARPLTDFVLIGLPAWPGHSGTPTTMKFQLPDGRLLMYGLVGGP